jgi:Na+-translocating ferredoxin:NAD+ oxidoreductase RnfA subunit
MEKWLTLGSIIISCIVLAVFLLDIIVGYPFQRSIFLDICAMLAAALVAYLSWDVYREIT